MTAKVDLKKRLDAYQARRGELRIIEVPEIDYLMIDGHGDPNTTPAYAEMVRTLFPVAYALKFASKRDLGRDYVVPPLEALWWAEDMASFTTWRDKSRWDWTLMILVPDWIDAAMCRAAIDHVAARGGAPHLGELRVEALSEGRCVQTLHVGSYDDEGAVLARMHEEFIPDHGLCMVGKHHEIYLNDPRRVSADRLRTILRQPVRAAAPAGDDRIPEGHVPSRQEPG